MIAVVFLWGHALAALLYTGLFLWQLRTWRADGRSQPLVTAFLVMAVWSIFMATLGPYHFLSQLADSGRHLAFLAFMYGLMEAGEDDHRQRPVRIVYAAVAAVIALQIVLGGLLPSFQHEPIVTAALISTAEVIGLAAAAGSLVLVHNIYGQAAPQSRSAIRLTMVALAIMWVYDLHLYTAAYLMRETPVELFAARGAVLALLVPLFGLSIKRWTRFKVQLSRAATFQSLSLLVVVAYLIVMMTASRAIEAAGGDWFRVAQFAFLGAMSLAALILLPSPRARSWAGVMLQKHFFQHRYDYREEWLRFTNTVGDGEAPLAQRVVKALADIGGAPAGLLLMRADGDRLAPAGDWHWPAPGEADAQECAALLAYLERTGHVVDFAALDAGALATPDGTIDLPPALAQLGDAWAGVPLVHCGRLLGLVVVGHPPIRRPLDWEDYDLLRAAGRQAASYIAEARGQEALAQSARFDEFNRRFAFILHDIKNLVSQLSLVARNAERHADNPAFRADMVATLQSSVRKMNDLLARLAPGTKHERLELRPRPVSLQPILAAIVEARRRAHPVTLAGDARLQAQADPAALEQAIGHLVQNAIEASPPDAPVEVSVDRRGAQVVIEVRDRGCGMSADFVQHRLFQPFVSTKETGFGIGAHEARTLIHAMGGRIDVESRPGGGSRFLVRLPFADARTLPEPDRISA
jgi:putative PEP-CTERM system histidine kinase